jgi:hypothetical protein
MAALLVLAACSSGTELAGDGDEEDASDPGTDALPDEATDESTVEVDCGIEVAEDAEASTTCPIVDPESLGDCALPLGTVFDGTSCVSASGCACAAPACRAFASPAECARTCADAGRCDLAMIPRDDYPYLCTAGFCDALAFCLTGDVATLRDAVTTLFPSIYCGEDVDYRTCPDEPPCAVHGGYTRGEVLAAACPLTLLPGIDRPDCFIAF